MKDSNTFTDFLNRHHPMVWRMCWVASWGNYERCRDLMQEVSIALWIHYEQLRPDASPQEERAWVRWRTRSVIDLQRRLKKNMPAIPLPPEMEDTLSSSDVEPQREELDHLMESLGADEKHLLQMLLEGYRADEIGEALGMGRDVVYQRYHRAVKKMRRVALLVLLIGIAATVSVAVVPQWREQVFSPAKEVETPAEEVVTPKKRPSPTPSESLETPVDTVVPRPAWIPPEPIPHLAAVADTILPDVPERKPEIEVFYDGKKLVLKGLVDGESVVVRNTKGVLVALKRCHGSSCVLEFPSDGHPYTTYLLQIGNRPDRIRIEL